MIGWNRLAVSVAMALALVLGGCEGNKEEVEKLKADLEAARADLAEAHGGHDQMAAQVADLEKQRDALKSDVEKHAATITQLQADLKGATDKLTGSESLAEQVKTLTKERDLATTALDQAKERIQSLLTEATRHNETIGGLKEQIQKLQATIGDLEKRLKALVPSSVPPLPAPPSPAPSAGG